MSNIDPYDPPGDMSRDEALRLSQELEDSGPSNGTGKEAAEKIAGAIREGIRQRDDINLEDLEA